MLILRRKFLLVITSLLLLMTASMAQAQDDHPAQVTVKGAITGMLDFLSENNDAIMEDPSILNTKVDELFVPHIDFETMTRLAVGKNWRKADETQQIELVTEFETLLLKTYTSAMTQYSGEEIEFVPFRPENREDRAKVRSNFKLQSGSEVPVIYKLRDRGGWKIYDIDVSGLSLVNNFRTKFTDEINANGVDGLLNFLKERNAQ